MLKRMVSDRIYRINRINRIYRIYRINRIIWKCTTVSTAYVTSMEDGEM